MNRTGIIGLIAVIVVVCFTLICLGAQVSRNRKLETRIDELLKEIDEMRTAKTIAVSAAEQEDYIFDAMPLPTVYELGYTNEEIELIALIVMAEAEGESEYGQRLVIDTILNRLDSGYFPNTIGEVVYQKGQFTCITNGRANRCYVKEELCDLVVQEMTARTNIDVIFFRAGKYSKYGRPLFKEGGHYFSAYS